MFSSLIDSINLNSTNRIDRNGYIPLISGCPLLLLTLYNFKRLRYPNEVVIVT